MRYVFHTDNLVLRPLDIGDAASVHRYASDPWVTRYMMHLPNHTMAETEMFLRDVTQEWRKEKPRFYEFALDKDGIQIGAVSVYLNADGSEGEIGWILHPDYQRQGYATEAAMAVRDFAFHTLHVSRLIAHCDDRNTPSYRVMEKLKMRLVSVEGEREDHITGTLARERTYRLDNPEQL